MTAHVVLNSSSHPKPEIQEVSKWKIFYRQQREKFFAWSNLVSWNIKVYYIEKCCARKGALPPTLSLFFLTCLINLVEQTLQCRFLPWNVELVMGLSHPGRKKRNFLPLFSLKPRILFSQQHLGNRPFQPQS